MHNVNFSLTNLKSVLNYKRAKILRPFFPTSYNLVTSSPWPLLVSLRLLNFKLSVGATLHNFNKGFYSFTLTFLTLLCYFTKWNGNVIRHASYIEDHTNVVSVSLKISFLVFIVSEAMLFVPIFGGFFYWLLNTCLSPASFSKCFMIFWRYINVSAMGIKWSLFLGISLDGLGKKKVQWKPIFYFLNKT